jgi:hypothetical protein
MDVRGKVAEAADCCCDGGVEKLGNVLAQASPPMVVMTIWPDDDTGDAMKGEGEADE